MVGMDVLGELWFTKLQEALVQVIDRPVPALELGSKAASAQPPPHGRWLGQQSEVVHGEAVISQGANDLAEVGRSDKCHGDNQRPVIGDQRQSQRLHDTVSPDGPVRAVYPSWSV